MLDPKLEREFTRMLERVEHDIHEAIRSMVAVELLEQHAGHRVANGEMTYQYNDWWMFLLRAAQNHLFICLGRLLDKAADSASIESLLKLCESHHRIFAAAQVHRRLVHLGQSSESSKEQLEQTQDPTDQEFKLLRERGSWVIADSRECIWRIRSRWYAHARNLNEEEAKALFDPATKEKIQSQLKELFQLTSQIRWMVNKGGRLSEAQSDDFEFFVSSCRDVFRMHIGIEK